MLPIGILATWAAYAVGSWGYVLIKGYDISFRQWVSPLRPYSGGWPPNKIPTGKLWPTGTTATVTTAATEVPVTEPGGNA